ncbi:MAG TPA: hypothetical protein EYH22_02990 [Candidatus Nanopusillus sp.]|nr:hypothetical protein [Candidatus Nanopusillus sp.]
MSYYMPEKYIKEKVNKMLNIFIILTVILLLITYFFLESLSFYHILVLSGVIIAATVIFAIKLVKTVEEYEKYSAGFTTYYPKYPGYPSYQKVNYKKYLYLIISIAIGYLLIVYIFKYGEYMSTLEKLTLLSMYCSILACFLGIILEERVKAGEISSKDAEEITKAFESLIGSIKSFRESYYRINTYGGVTFLMFIFMLYLCVILKISELFPINIVYGTVAILTGLLSPLVLNLIYYKKPIPENIEKIPFSKKMSILSWSSLGFIGIVLIVSSIISRSEMSNVISLDITSLMLSFVFTYFYYKVVYRIGWRLAKDT